MKIHINGGGPKEVFLAFLLFIVFIIIIGAILALPTKLLWNWLIVKIFGLPKINLLEAFGINLLCSILFKTGKDN